MVHDLDILPFTQNQIEDKQKRIFFDKINLEMIKNERTIELHNLDLKMTIRDFKSYVLAINGHKPFFLEFNMDNSQKLSDLAAKSKNELYNEIKIYHNLNYFDLKCED